MYKDINLFELPSREIPPPTPLTQLLAPPLSSTLRFQMSRIIEALLFASSEPISFDKLRQVVEHIGPIKPRELRTIILGLQHDYQVQQRAFRLEEVAEGFVLRSSGEYASYIELMIGLRRSERLSHAASEVLAIVAYRQPITRPQIDAIRGVDSSGTLYNLLERGLVAAVGKLETPGRPTLYAITSAFLKHFGLRTVEELPALPATT
jgi:segregation and condensation protein B